MAYQGEDFVQRDGAKAAEATPLVKRMLASGVPVGGIFGVWANAGRSDYLNWRPEDESNVRPAP
jgi:hypothetical protein